MVLLSVGLPDDYRSARVAFWLADEGILDRVRERLGAGFEPAIRNFVLARAFHEAVLAERPDLGNSSRDLADRLKANFPQPSEITVADLSSTIRRALLLNRKELPLTLLVLDETQEFLRNDPDRTGIVRSIAERKPPSRKDRIVLLNASRRVAKGRPKNYIPEPDIRPFAAAFLKGDPVEGEIAVITRRQAEDADYNLSPSRWVGSTAGGDETHLFQILDRFDAIITAEARVSRNLQAALGKLRALA